MGFDELIHYIRLGGMTMAVLLVSSVVALGVAIERIISLWNVSSSARALSEVISKHLLRGDTAAARSAAERSNAVAADLYLAGFARLDRSKGLAGVEGAVERERSELLLRLRRNIWILGTIGATSPFVGLFGTVAGIMRAFKDLGLDVGEGGSGGSAAVMTGISEALIATAAGILIALEAVYLYNYFQAKLARVAVELRLLSDEFVELLKERPYPGSTSAAAVPVEAAAAPATAAVTSAEGT